MEYGGYPKRDGLEWKIPLKWMIWGCPYFRKPLYVGKRRGLLFKRFLDMLAAITTIDSHIIRIKRPKKQQLKAHSARHKQVWGILKSMGVGELGAEIDAYVCVCINICIYIYIYVYVYVYVYYIILYYIISY